MQTTKTGVHGTINVLGLVKQALIPQVFTSEVYGDPKVRPQPELCWVRVNPIGTRSRYDEGKPYKSKTSPFMAMVGKRAAFTGFVNAGNSGELTMLQLAETILRLTNSKSKTVFAPLPSDNPKERQLDITLAKAKLSWRPKVNLEDDIKETMFYFKQVAI